MTINPFIIAGKIEKKYFCDRQAEQEELINRISNGHNVVLISPRRMGKTGLIEICYENSLIKKNYYTFFIDILQTSSLREFIFLLGKEIYSELVPRSKRMAKGFVQALKSLGGHVSFDSITGLPFLNISIGDIRHPELTLDEIFAYLAGADMRCIIAIDEFQQIANYQEKNVEAILRTHIQHSTNCNFIFSGSQRHILREMFISSARPFFNSASFMHLNPIPEEIYTDFIVKLFKEKGKLISKHLASEIYNKFEGHTYYVHRTCNEAFACTPAGDECDNQILQEAIDKILASYETLYRELLSQLPVKQKELLYAIAGDGKVSGITSVEFIRRNALSSASSVQSAARMLLGKEILTKVENTYSVADRFFAMWIRRMLRF